MSKRNQEFTLRCLPHERLATLENELDDDGKNPFYGYIFGIHPTLEFYFICIPRQELVRHGMEGHGPCINRMVPKGKITLLEEEFVTLSYQESELVGEVSSDGNNDEDENSQ